MKFLFIKTKLYKNKDYFVLMLSFVVFFMIINVKCQMATYAGILTFMKQDKYHAQLS